MSSCWLSKKSHVTKIEEPEIVVEKEIIDTFIIQNLYSKNNSDTSNLKLSFQYYKNPKFPWQDSINLKIAEFIHGITLFEYPDDLQLKCDINQFSNCLDTFVKNAKIDYTENEYKTLWELEASSSIHEDYEQFTSFYCGVYNYTGGAHGNSFYNHIQIDKKTGKTLLLKDFVSDTLAFNVIADSCFRKQNLISPTADLSELGFWFEDGIFRCNNNFYITDDAFYFIFNVYEIAPYSFGLIEFSVPFTLSKHLLQIDLSKKMK